MTELNHGRNRRILVVDDNHAIHDDFRKILSPGSNTATALEATEAELFGRPQKVIQQIRYEIDSAYQGQEAVMLVKKALADGRPYAMAFVDVRMPPGWDGVETTGKIWAVDPEVQIVLCTAYADYSWAEMFERLGNSDGLVILKKPFDTVEALQLAQTLTEKWWLHQQSRRKMEELESRVAERTRKLAQSLSLLNATLESTADGVVAVDLSGKVVSYNTKFAACWQFPAEMLARGDAAEMRAHTAEQVKDSALFLRRIKELQTGPEAEVFDVIELKDGRTFERYIFPQRINGKRVGEVINWRDITKRRRAEAEAQLKTAFLEAQVNSSIDGILVVDQAGKTILQNQRLVDLLKIPEHLADEKVDENRLRWVTGTTKNPGQFIEKVVYLYSHPNKISRDEVELKDGTILDRYSAPVVGHDGKYYGRIWTFRDITERRRTEDALRESNEKFHQLADNITDVFWIRSPDLREVHYVSPAFERIWGRPAASLYANPHQWSDFILPEDRQRVLDIFATLAGEARSLDTEYRIVRPDGDIRWVRVRGFQVRDAADRLIRHAGIVTDITERKRLEAQLFQSQKLETVGKLAGGFAHEFNSILTAIIGQSELLLGDLPTGSPLAKSATEISKAANRAATLTRQLLAYGRKQFLQSETLDLNRIIAGMESVFRLLLGGAVDMQMVPAPGLHPVKADAGQIEQVIMNLVINARDAMPNGGKLTLETANVSFDHESVGRYPELKAGDYVMLAVSDTGIGMSAEVKEHVFEPFFTTKGVGEGTGLGLSASYGIIKQSGGHISVYSEPGRGTTFKMYLPQAEPQVNIPVQRLDSPGLPRGTETILLVEDDPALREMAATLLRRLGYTVWAAANGIEALSLKQRRDIGHIDLLFTDVVMPHMSGKELADRMRSLHPHTRILFTSAYTQHAIVHQGVLDKGVALLQKPFTPSALALKVRQVLD